MYKISSFKSRHPWDSNFFLVMIGFAWVAILSGFINDIIKLNSEGRLHFPIVVHFHAAIFFGWLLLFTIQVLLIRRGNLQLHKKLGIAGAVLAVFVFILGVMTALITENVKFGTKFSDPAFVGVMLGDMLVFAVLATAGISMRKNPPAHKRLMLIATLILTDAGFGRGISIWLASFLGKPYWEYSNFVDAFWPFFVRQLSCPFTLIFMVGVYDIITRKRLHPAYVWGLLFALSVDLTAGWLYFNPEWLKIATKLIGH
ncbi:MAG: hypothetical protein IPM98_10195 [Lewinellaceae bacterium]|nr:hypothetical protein [Lewinellaceae bacterium]